MLASNAPCPFAFCNCLICSRRRPTSSDNSIIRESLSFIMVRKVSSVLLGGCCTSIACFCISTTFSDSEEKTSPLPVNIQSAETPNSNTIFCIAVRPTELLPLEISVTIDGLTPILPAKSFLSDVLPNERSLLYASMKRLEISFFVVIIQNIEK